jgi:hypothetical protein
VREQETTNTPSVPLQNSEELLRLMADKKQVAPVDRMAFAKRVGEIIVMAMRASRRRFGGGS